jgi:hypothetical protein
MEHICRQVNDSHPSTDDDLAALSTTLGRKPLNIAPQFPSRGWAILSGFISIIASIAGVAYPFDSIETLAWWSSLAGYPRRHGRKGDRHRGCRNSLMSHKCSVAQLTDAATVTRESVARQ